MRCSAVAAIDHLPLAGGLDFGDVDFSHVHHRGETAFGGGRHFFSATHATMRSGPPLPSLIFMGSATTYAPVAGS